MQPKIYVAERLSAAGRNDNSKHWVCQNDAVIESASAAVACVNDGGVHGE